MAGAPDGIFNFEGGCYAKTIRLSAEAEPEIFATTHRFGTVLENVVLDADRVPDFDDGSLTENTRCAYPLDFIPNASATGRAGHPKNIIMLTADAFGVMPPIARLTPAQAMYHFLSGYTAKVAGTEKGVTEPEATFSTCFGAPFMPRHPSEYGNLLRQLDRRARRRLLAGQHRLDRRRLWHRQAHADQGDARAAGGRARRLAQHGGIPHRRRISASRCRSPCRASTGRSSIRARPGPTRRPMTAQAKRLVGMFIDNFGKFETHVDAAVRGAAPQSRKRRNSRLGQVRHSPKARRKPGLFFFGGVRAITVGMARANDKIIIAAKRESSIPGRSRGELHPLIRSRRPERQQGRDRRAVALRCRATRRGLSERVRERTIQLAGQRATKDGVIVIEAGRFRTQEQNRADARARLTALVAKAAEPPPPPRKKTRPTKGSVERRLKSKAGRSTVKKLRGQGRETTEPHCTV